MIGLVGAALVLGGASWYQALIIPPYRYIDEQAHAGYVLALQGGQLPTIDTPIDQERAGPALRTRLRTEPERRGHVWVANNPPFPYALAAGPGAVTRALGLPGGPLLGLRLLNVAAGMGAIVLTFRLARDLSGGDASVGLVAAGLLAATPHLGFASAVGFTDGIALLATTGVLSSFVRVVGAGSLPWQRRTVIELGAWCAAAAAVRPMALVFAGVAAAMALAITGARRQAPWWWSTAWLAGPTLVLTAWHYLANVARYGDPTGSQALLDKFFREPSGTVWSNLRLTGAWEFQLRTLTTRRLEVALPTDSQLWFQLTMAIVAASIAIVVATIAASTTPEERRPRWMRGRELPSLAWLGTAVLTIVPFVLAAQHRAGGGSPHPRYLLPILPILATVVAVAATRLATRRGAALLVAALAVATYGRVRESARWLADNPKGPPGSELVTAYGNELVRGLGLAAFALGAVALIVVLVAPAASRSEISPMEPSPQPARHE